MPNRVIFVTDLVVSPLPKSLPPFTLFFRSYKQNAHFLLGFAGTDLINLCA